MYFCISANAYIDVTLSNYYNILTPQNQRPNLIQNGIVVVTIRIGYTLYIVGLFC